jgi:hypothetical protein
MKMIKSWLAKHTYQWFRPEYKRVQDICYYAGCVFMLIIATVAIVTSKIGDAEITPQIVTMSLVLLYISMVIGMTMQIVDSHEKKLHSKKNR